jgi:hypothetical protein
LSIAEPNSEEEQANFIMMKNTVAAMKKRLPDTKWLLILIGTLMPADPIFHKSFKWIRPKLVEEEDDYLSNDDGFYNGKNCFFFITVV